MHHVTASSYRQAIQHFSPNILLGLTATPERHDGGNILEDFGGVIAAEIRLPEAINQRHLCPFQYFAIDDGTDLSEVSWQNGRYQISELSKLYTQSDKRSAQIIQNLSEIVTDIQEIKALAFCVSQEHADYMAKKFLLKGINADVLTSKNSEHRNAKRQALSNGDINILCVVDIFNEGVDIPEIDTLLFLRPTESLTIFLQQLGRGLRLPSKYSTKEVCTVLDFVGNARPEYDFANKFRALLGKTKQPIDKEIEKGFPNLPLGCRIELQKQTQTTILKNIRQAVNSTQRLRRLIQQYSQHTNLPLTLKNFLHIYPNVQLEDIYKSSHKGIGGWNWLINQDISEQDKPLYKAYYRAINTQLLNCNSISYLRFLQKLCLNNFEVQLNTNPYSLIAYFNFWDKDSKTTKFQSIEQSLKALKHQKLQKELSEMLELLIAKVDHQELQLPSIVNHPIKVHSRYTREQILAGFGDSTFKRKSSAREGVVAINNSTTLLLFVTLDKCEKNYSPTTLYHDYAISPSLFHWQSQNASTPDSGRGLSYIEQKPNGTTIILFVREKNKDQYGRTMGFVNFGEVEYRKHHGSKPMNITWQLKQEMPNQLWHDAAKLALG